MNPTNMDSIMKRLAHLKALADNPGTEAEATEAVAAIQRLIRKHNLSEAQVNAAQRKTSDYEMLEIPGFPAAEWRRTILSALVKTTQCVVVWKQREGTQTPVIFGQHHNIASVIAMNDYLGAAAERLGDEGWWDLSLHERRETTARRWKHAFRTGCSLRIAERLLEAMREAEAQETSQEHGLMVVEVDNINAKIRKTFSNLIQRQAVMHHSDLGAHARGYEAGETVGLHKHVRG